MESGRGLLLLIYTLGHFPWPCEMTRGQLKQIFIELFKATRNPNVHHVHRSFPFNHPAIGIFQTGPGRVEADGHEGMIRH